MALFGIFACRFSDTSGGGDFCGSISQVTCIALCIHTLRALRNLSNEVMSMVKHTKYIQVSQEYQKHLPDVCKIPQFPTYLKSLIQRQEYQKHLTDCANYPIVHFPTYQ